MPPPRCRSDFEALMLPHLDAAYNLACWILRDLHEAEDGVQDVYLKAYEAFPQYRGGSGAKGAAQACKEDRPASILRAAGRRSSSIAAASM